MTSENTTALTYFEVAYQPEKGACSVSYLSNQELSWPFSKGQRLADLWPSDMTVSMNPEKPKDVALIDYIHNLEDKLLASPRLRAFLEEQQLPDLEFLPVTILDHKGRVASKDYTVVNCCRVVDCVDQANSQFEWDGLKDPSMVMRRMALKADVLSEDDRMIRPQFVPGRILYRADLREALNAQRFTGLAFSRRVFGDSTVYRRPR